MTATLFTHHCAVGMHDVVPASTGSEPLHGYKTYEGGSRKYLLYLEAAHPWDANGMS